MNISFKCYYALGSRKISQFDHLLIKLKEKPWKNSKLIKIKIKNDCYIKGPCDY